MRPEPGPKPTIVDPDRLPRVAVVPAVLSDDGHLLGTVAERVEGLVVAAFGVGHVPAAWVPILAETAARIPVVLASRTGGGSVLANTYGFAGSEKDLLARGLISAGTLDPHKARILLSVLLAGNASHADIVTAFTQG